MKQTASRMSHPADREAEAASKVTELPQGEINEQPSWWATNSFSAAEALKSVGKRLLLLSLEDYCSVTRKKKLPLESQNFLCWVIFQCFWVCYFSSSGGSHSWRTGMIQYFFWENFFLRMTIYFPSSVPLPRPSVRLEESGLWCVSTICLLDLPFLTQESRPESHLFSVTFLPRENICFQCRTLAFYFHQSQGCVTSPPCVENDDCSDLELCLSAVWFLRLL